nr:DUF1573 domain-containing protein [uncultured Cellulosilyticum sp.]
MATNSSELKDFQDFIDTVLIRNKSILDQTTKLQDACTHLCRAISKASTTCGCITINASKQPYPITEEVSLDEVRTLLSTHVNGTLCPACEELISKEMGRVLFYLGAIANTFNIPLSKVLEDEQYRTALLGKYSLR